MARSPRSSTARAPRRRESTRVREAAPSPPAGGRRSALRRAPSRFRTKLAAVALGAVAALLIGLVLLLGWMGDLSALKDLEADFDRRVTLSYVYSDGAQMRVEGDRPGPLIDVTRLPRHVVDAVLAAEDHDFYAHSGFQFGSIVAAALANVRAGRIVGGGSTITQQLVKNTYGAHEQTFSRKLREAIVASQAEGYFRAKMGGKKLGKDRILALYMSRIELGYDDNQPVVGWEDAAQFYYGHAAAQLSLGEAAMLAALLRNWRYFSPRTDYPRAATARDRVLERMLRFGFIDQAQHDRAVAERNIPVERRNRSYRYALDDLRPGIRDLARAQHQDLRIATTIDAAAQQLAAEVIAERLRGRPNLHAALVAITGDGAIRVMIGGRDYAISQFNAASHGSLSVGSSLKPFVYLTALAQGATGDSLCSARAPRFPDGWAPPDSHIAEVARLPLHRALAVSSNRVAVRLGEEVGRDAAMTTFRTVGYPTSRIGRGETWVLTSSGTPVDLAAAYLPFVNGGVRIAPHLYSGVSDERGMPVRVPDTRPTPTRIDPALLAQMRSLMREVVRSGTGVRAGQGLGIAVAGKTGTTNDNRDSWFTGLGDGFVVTVWVGRRGADPYPDEVQGPKLPSLIFNDFLRRQRAGWVRGLAPELLPPPPPAGQPDLSATPGAAPARAFTTGRAPPGLGCAD